MAYGGEKFIKSTCIEFQIQASMLARKWAHPRVSECRKKIFYHLYLDYGWSLTALCTRFNRSSTDGVSRQIKEYAKKQGLPDPRRLGGATPLQALDLTGVGDSTSKQK